MSNKNKILYIVIAILVIGIIAIGTIMIVNKKSNFDNVNSNSTQGYGVTEDTGVQRIPITDEMQGQMESEN